MIRGTAHILWFLACQRRLQSAESVLGAVSDEWVLSTVYGGVPLDEELYAQCAG